MCLLRCRQLRERLRPSKLIKISIMTSLCERLVADVKRCESTLKRVRDIRNVLNYETSAKNYEDALKVAKFLVAQDYANQCKVSLNVFDECVILSIGIRES